MSVINSINDKYDNRYSPSEVQCLYCTGYKERLTMPKVVIHAANDEFFHLDDPHYFFDDLPEPKYLM